MTLQVPAGLLHLLLLLLLPGAQRGATPPGTETFAEQPLPGASDLGSPCGAENDAHALNGGVTAEPANFRPTPTGEICLVTTLAVMAIACATILATSQRRCRRYERGKEP